VFHVSGKPIAGAAAAVKTLRERGHRLRVVTNMTVRTGSAIGAELRRLGVGIGGDERQTTAAAAVRLLHGRRVVALTMPSVIEALHGLGLVGAHLSPRLDANTKRADRPGDIGVLARRVSGNACALQIHCVDGISKAEVRQFDPVRAERIRFDDVGAGAHIRLMHFGHKIGLGQVQLVERPVQEDAALVQHGAHRAITDEDALIERFEERFQITPRLRAGCGCDGPRHQQVGLVPDEVVLAVDR